MREPQNYPPGQVPDDIDPDLLIPVSPPEEDSTDDFPEGVTP